MILQTRTRVRQVPRDALERVGATQLAEKRRQTRAIGRATPSKIVARTLVSAASTLVSTRFEGASNLPFSAIFIICCAPGRRMPTRLATPQGIDPHGSSCGHLARGQSDTQQQHGHRDERGRVPRGSHQREDSRTHESRPAPAPLPAAIPSELRLGFPRRATCSPASNPVSNLL